MAIKNSELNDEIITQIFEIHEKIIGKGNTIKFIWIPGHIRIIYNEKANQATKKEANSHNKWTQITFGWSNKRNKKQTKLPMGRQMDTKEF